MSLLSKGLRTLGITPSEVAQIGAAYATGGLTAAGGAAISSLGGPKETQMTPPFVPAGSDYDRYMGRFGGTEQGQSVAVSQATQTRPQETQASGEFFPRQAPMQAGFGLAAPITQIARRFAPEIIGGLGIGAGAAVAPIMVDAITGQPKKLRVTRKLKRLVREAVDNFGIRAAMEMSGLDQDTIMYIYTKKMRNDGPYVTKAAVRKTRQTVRKMKNLCDMYDDLRPAAKRRAPARRMAAGTRITQVK
jgi:hypothetical protein